MIALTHNLGWFYCKAKPIQAYLREVGPEIVCFQEGAKIAFFDFIKFYFSKGYEVETEMYQGCWAYGWKLGFLTKLGITHYSVKDIWEPKGSWNDKAQGVVLNKTIRVVNTHLASGISVEDKLLQVRECVEYLKTLPADNLTTDIFAGDLNINNSERYAPIYEYLNEEGLCFNCNNGCDYIFSNQKPTSCNLVLEGTSDVSSHIAVEMNL